MGRHQRRFFLRHFHLRSPTPLSPSPPSKVTAVYQFLTPQPHLVFLFVVVDKP
ncbi:hypothetical protein HID58_006388 [Brassica napus]|uniref:Uncharacterized protein n=1 Tax=Brassica napus TaxID=3708 RepID=A0ABQ8EBD0_BRANA|nr:hypothetical protein HID58_007978 [Brassica napus]KAH0938927.1 hypothetical protein HID58_006388 [Brassica napus]